MKQSRLLLTLALVALIGLSGCIKNIITLASTANSSYTMLAYVNGSPVSLDLCNAVIVDGKLVISGSSSGSTEGAPHIALTIYAWNGTTGNTGFTIPTGTNAYAEYSAGIGSNKVSYSGYVSITTVTNTDIVGNFTFDCSGASVTGGTFTAKRM
jgi:hypothetical protein